MPKYDVDISKLSSLNVYQLREVGFKIGVKNPTTMTTHDLRDEIMKIVLGTVQPYHKKKLGRPRKKELIPDSKWNQMIGFDNTFEQNYPIIYSSNSLARSTNSSELNKIQDQEFSGFVYGFDSALYFFANSKSWEAVKYANIDPNLPNYYSLHSGDYITCKLDFLHNPCSVSEVTSINNIPITDIGKPLSPHKTAQLQFNLTQLKFINEKCPFSLGQRVCVHGPTAAGQTYLCNSFAKNFDENFHVVLFSIAKKPEEKITLVNGEYYFSTFDVDDQSVVFYFDLLCEHVKRLSKLNKDVIFIVDDINTLMKSIYNYAEFKRHQTPGLIYAQIDQQIKKLLSCSGQNENGSITLILSCSDDALDTQLKNLLYSLNKMCNTHIMLDRTAYMQGDMEFFVENETYTESIRNV